MQKPELNLLMSTFSVTDISGQTADVEIREGWSLMELLRDAGYDDILAMCGGSCSCATCHVYVQESPALPVMEEDEQILLEDEPGYDAQTSRLSCQIPMSDALDGLKVSLVSDD